MAEMRYLDFDLLIERWGEHYKARVLNSPAGQATVDFSMPFSEQDVEIFLLKVGRPRRSTRRVFSPEMEAAKSFGARLFETIFDDEVLGCFRTSLYDATQKGVGLRLRLRITNALDLADLPWEYLYNPTLNRFLSLSVETPIVRYLELPEPIRPLAIKPPLRVLVMISSPHDYPELDVEQEWKKLRDAVSHLNRKGLLTLERLDDARLATLQRQLRQKEYHMFHFIGHGGFDKQVDDGVLILEDEAERGRSVNGQYLGTLLHNHRPLRLAILNACEGARVSRNDPFAGTAQSLVQQGIPAVIAMQFEITDEAAITFAHEFYTAVADGYPVDAAMVEARTAIFAQGNNIEWGTPVLYMRAPDGRIFDIASDEREKTNGEKAAAHPKLLRRRIFIASTLAVSFLLVILVFLLKPALFKKLSPPLENAPSSVSTGSDTAATSLKPTASVSIKVNPPDAEVNLDGKRIGLSKLSGMALAVGPHTLSISRQGYKTLNEKFSVTPGDTTIEYSLQREEKQIKPPELPTAGGMQIESRPPGAAILVNGQPLTETTPHTIRDLAARSYAIGIRKAGYEDYDTTVSVTGGKVEKINAILTAFQGKLRVIIKPSGLVYIDNVLKNEKVTDSLEISLSPNSHRVKIESPGLGFIEKTVNIEADERQQLTMDFTKKVTLKVNSVDSSGKHIWGEIWLDDQYTNKNTPRDLSVQVGQHKIGVRRQGFTLVGGEKVINLEKDEKVEFVLKSLSKKQ